MIVTGTVTGTGTGTVTVTDCDRCVGLSLTTPPSRRPSISTTRRVWPSPRGSPRRRWVVHPLIRVVETGDPGKGVAGNGPFGPPIAKSNDLTTNPLAHVNDDENPLDPL
eukprot:9485407-Pyramimonas_sp.AAC.1